MISNQDRLSRLHELKAQARLGGGARRRQAQHDRGKLTARERIDLLLDPGTFEEIDQLVLHRATAFGLERQHYLGDAVVTGHGRVDGRVVFVFAQDFTTLGGTLSEAMGEKIAAESRTGCARVWPWNRLHHLRRHGRRASCP